MHNPNKSHSSKKGVLIISYGYPPFNAPSVQRPYTLAKYLDKDKYTVTVLTCPNADSSLGFDPTFDENLPDVKLLKVAAKFGSKISGLRVSGETKKKKSLLTALKKRAFTLGASIIFPDKAIFWYHNAKNYLNKHPELLAAQDVVFTSSPVATNHVLGRYVQKKDSTIKWVAEFEDYHYLESMSHKKTILASLHKRLEKMILKKADEVTFVSKTMCNNYAKAYPKHQDKFSVVYNGFDTDNYKQLTFQQLEQTPLTIMYAGSFYKGVRAPFPLLELLDASFKAGLLKKEEVVVKIAGNFEEELLTQAKQYVSFDCVQFLGRVPRAEVLKMYTNAHLLWLIVGKKVEHYTSVPLKLFEYLAARRTILNFAPQQSEASAIIDAYHLGTNFDVHSEASEALQNKFFKILTQFKNNELSEPLASQEIEIFNRKQHALQFQELF